MLDFDERDLLHLAEAGRILSDTALGSKPRSLQSEPRALGRVSSTAPGNRRSRPLPRRCNRRWTNPSGIASPPTCARSLNTERANGGWQLPTFAEPSLLHRVVQAHSRTHAQVSDRASRAGSLRSIACAPARIVAEGVVLHDRRPPKPPPPFASATSRTADEAQSLPLAARGHERTVRAHDAAYATHSRSGVIPEHWRKRLMSSLDRLSVCT